MTKIFGIDIEELVDSLVVSLDGDISYLNKHNILKPAGSEEYHFVHEMIRFEPGANDIWFCFGFNAEGLLSLEVVGDLSVKEPPKLKNICSLSESPGCGQGELQRTGRVHQPQMENELDRVRCNASHG